MISIFYQNRGNRPERRGPLLAAEHRLPRSQALPRRGWRQHIRHRQERHGQLWLELHLTQTLWSFISSENSQSKYHNCPADQVSPMEPVIGAVIGALTGSDDPNEVAVMAKQASEVQRSDLSSSHHCSISSSNNQTPYILLEQPNMISCCRWWTWWSPWSRLSPPRWARGPSQPTTSTPTTRQTSSQNFKINKFFQNCSFCDSRYCRQHGWSKKVLIISEFQAIQSF